MDKVIVELCMGTTCFVMGGSAVADFPELLTEDERNHIDVKHAACIGLCKDRKYGKAPYATVAGEVIAEATAINVAEKVKEFLNK